MATNSNSFQLPGSDDALAALAKTLFAAGAALLARVTSSRASAAASAVANPGACGATSAANTRSQPAARADSAGTNGKAIPVAASGVAIPEAGGAAAQAQVALPLQVDRMILTAVDAFALAAASLAAATAGLAAASAAGVPYAARSADSEDAVSAPVFTALANATNAILASLAKLGNGAALGSTVVGRTAAQVTTENACPIAQCTDEELMAGSLRREAT